MLGGVAWGVAHPSDAPKTSSPDIAARGDCALNKGSHDKPVIEMIDCGDAKAEYKVAARNPDRPCPAAYSQYEQTRNGRVVLTLCLARIDH